MTTKNYKIIVPVSPLHCMEITTLHCDSPLWKQQNDKPALQIFQTENLPSKEYLELHPEDLEYHKVLHFFKATNRQLMEMYGQIDSFMMASTKGFQIVKINNILLFDYSKTKKLWTVVLADNTNLVLRRSVTAEHILQFSKSFFRINQQQIINLKYLDQIIDKSCVLTTHPSNLELVISRSYLKKLQDHFLQI